MYPNFLEPDLCFGTGIRFMFGTIGNGFLKFWTTGANSDPLPITQKRMVKPGKSKGLVFNHSRKLCVPFLSSSKVLQCLQTVYDLHTPSPTQCLLILKVFLYKLLRSNPGDFQIQAFSKSGRFPNSSIFGR